MGPWNEISFSDGNTLLPVTVIVSPVEPDRARHLAEAWFVKASNAMLYRSPHRGRTLEATIQLELRVPPNLQCPSSDLEPHLDSLRGWVPAKSKRH